MSRRWRIGLAGAGWVSQYHLAAWGTLPQAMVVALCDPDLSRAQQRAEAFGVAAVFGDAQTMLARGDLDALDVAAPRECHASLVRLGASHGLPVLCQKPLAPSLNEAEALIADIRGKTRLMVHDNWRFRPYYRKAAEWIRSGAIGTPRQCIMKLFTSSLVPGADGRRPLLERQPFLGTIARLMVMEVLIHHLDTARFLFGRCELAAASLGKINRDIAGEDHASLLLRTRQGAAVAILGNMAAPGFPAAMEDDVLILGDAGRITLENGVLGLEAATSETLRYDPEQAYRQSYAAAIEHFIECLESGAEFETAPDDNLETLRLVERAYAVGQ